MAHTDAGAPKPTVVHMPNGNYSYLVIEVFLVNTSGLNGLCYVYHFLGIHIWVPYLLAQNEQISAVYILLRIPNILKIFCSSTTDMYFWNVNVNNMFSYNFLYFFTDLTHSIWL